MWLIRHGEIDAVHEVGGPKRCLGWTDSPLVDPGQTARRMAENAELLERLTPELCPVDVVWSSDLSRALDTAHVLAGLLGARVAVDARLRELHFGAWEGMTWPQIEAAHPDAYWAFMDAWRTQPTPGGESYAALTARVAAWRVDAPEARVVVAHQGSLRALAALLTGDDEAHHAWTYGQAHWFPRATT